MNLLASGQLPFIPIVHSAEDVIFFMYVLARVSGFFLISPLFSNRTIRGPTRMMLAVIFSILFSMTLYNDYRGPNAIYILKELTVGTELRMLLLGITIFKEIIIGYLIGFSFSLVLESLLFAGQSVSYMMGLSISKLLDPVSGSTQTLLSQAFVLTGMLLSITLDFHHTFIIILRDSFNVLPIGNYDFPQEIAKYLTLGTGRLWHYAIRFAAIPYAVLFLVTVGLGFMAKIMPEMNIFMVGFPLKILIGYYSLIYSIGFFPLIVRQAFIEYQNLAKIFVSLFIPR